MTEKKELSAEELDTVLCQHIKEEEQGWKWKADLAAELSLHTKLEY